MRALSIVASGLPRSCNLPSNLEGNRIDHHARRAAGCSEQATLRPGRKEKKMATERSQNLQDTFLNHVRKNKTPLTIFLVNGVKLQGIVTWFDNFCVLLRRDGHSQLVYKHAISTVMPNQPIQLFDPTEEADLHAAGG
jgi:host factor-I protein